ncbi:MAG: beta-propeller fold lactonase family protein [Bulleidia sp.]|nr:beta-propeller fold lactonase family protein [Bulleidia sp.]
MKTMLYAGTYTAKSSQGIYSFSFEDGRLSSSQLFCEIKNPKYLTKKDNCLITVADFDYESGVALINAEGDIKNKIAFEKRTSCFITSEDDDIYTANYHTGVVTHLKLVQDELKFINSIQIQDGAGCHQILVFHDRILVPCLFLDRVFIFDRSLKKIGSIHFNANTGPRHGVFSKDGKYLYLVSELSNELFVIETDEWNIIHQIPVLMSKEIHVRDTAAIRLSDDEKFIYVSTRTKDVISVIELEDHKPTVIQTMSCGGKHPRDFVLLGQYLLCANKNTNEVVSFKINDDGTLGKIVDRIEVPEVVALIQQ